MENAGWYVYEDEDYEDSWYAEKSSADGLKYHIVNYYFDEDYGNVIIGYYREMGTELTTDTAWNADTSSAMTEELTEELPFMQFGKEYSGFNEDGMFYLVDGYYQDLSNNYVSVLTSNGYVYDGTEDGYRYYSKELTDQSLITVSPYYMGGYGNVLMAYYTPHTETSNTWPSSFLAPVETATGYTVPEFAADQYIYYEKNDVYYISAAASSSLEETYEGALELAGLIYDDGNAYSWEENLAMNYGDIGDYDDDDNFIVEGFQIAVAESTPESSFSGSWPSSQMSSYLAENNITTAPISFPDNLHKSYKYIEVSYADLYAEAYAYYYELYMAFAEAGWMDEEDAIAYAAEEAADYASANAGFYVSAFVVDEDALEDYLDELAGIPWYIEGPNSGYYYAEDASGDCAEWISYSCHVLTIQIIKGSEEAHEPVFALDRETAKAKPGSSLQLVLTKSMIADATVWSSSNESIATVDNDGLVTISDGATIDQTVTINADAGTYHAECVITISDTSYYVKVTSTSQVVDGEYLIVYDSGTAAYAFDGSLSSLDATSNYIPVTVTADGIEATTALHASAFNIVSAGDGDFTISNQSGVYIGKTADSNGMNTSEITHYTNTITIDSDGNANIIGSGGAYLRFNSSSGQTRFRYYKSDTYTAQKAIQLYILAE